MQRWLAAFSYSLLIIAVYLAWQAFVVQDRRKMTLFILGAAASAALAAMGIRARHRPR